MAKLNAIRILSVDDHPLLREGIAALIGNQPDVELIGGAASGTEAIQEFRKPQPDVTLMDLRLPLKVRQTHNLLTFAITRKRYRKLPSSMDSPHRKIH